MSTNNEEQALYKLSQILRRDDEIRRNFEGAASLATFGFGEPGDMWKSNESKDMLCIQLFGQHSLLQKFKDSYA